MAKQWWESDPIVQPTAPQGANWWDADPVVGQKPAEDPGLLDRAKQGLQSTVAAGQIATTNDPAEVARLVAEEQRTRLPATPTQRKMAAEIKPLQEAYEKATGVDAVGAFASLAAKRLSQFISNPSELAGSVVENLPNAAPGLAGGLAGAVAGTATPVPLGGAIGAVAGGTAGGYFVEQGAAMRDQVLKEAQARNIDPTDAKALEPIIREKYDEFLEKSRLKGAGTAATDAALNALTFGVAGIGERTLAKEARALTEGTKAGTVSAADAATSLASIEARQAARATIPARAVRGAGIIGAEMAGEGLSEAAGQKLAYGQVDALDVVDESILGLGQGAGMAAGRGIYNRATGQPTADSVQQSIEAARAEISRQRQVQAQENLGAATSAGDAAAAADALAGSVDELTAAVDDYLRGQPPAEPAPVERPTIEQLRARADREAELLAQADGAGFDFERQMALQQIEALRGPGRERTTQDFVDLTPMDERQAQNRLVVLREQVANEGGNALGLAIVPHPTQADRFAIKTQPLPSLDLTEPSNVTPVTQDEANARLEAAAFEGTTAARRAEDAPRQAMISRTMANIEARGGVASPYEAELLREANMGTPYNRVDPSLAPQGSVDERLSAATGIELTPETGTVGQQRFNQRLNEQANVASMADLEARAATETAQRDRELQQQIEQTSQPVAPPPASDVIQALVTPGPQRSAEQVATIRQAENRYDPADFSILQRAASAPFQLNTEERTRLRSLRSESPVAPAATTVTPDATEAVGRLAEPSAGRVITSDAKLSTQRSLVPGSTVSINDAGTEHQLEVVDASRLGVQGRLLQQIARIFGKRVVAFRSGTLAADGFVMNNDNRSIFLNEQSQVSPLAVFGHELTHLLKRDNPQAYAALQAVVEREMGEGAMQRYEQEYGQGADVEELTSDLMGNRFQEADFWQAVFDEVAAQNPEGARGIINRMVAAITRAVNAFLKVVRQPGYNADTYVKDIEAVKRAATQALAQYAQSQRGAAVQAETTPGVESAVAEGADVTLSAARRGGRVEQAGEFTVRAQKDGSLGVSGDADAIRALLPEGIKGRAVPGGMVFASSAAPRVRAALEGRKTGYSRAGQVIDKLPMKNGKYVGAPEKYNTPGKIATLRKQLMKLTREGEPGRFWYENSSQAILDMVGGVVDEAKKFAALLSIYSPQARVDGNSTFALRAWAQYRAGQPISVKTGVQDEKARQALADVDAFWSGEKTGNFVTNLLRRVDPSLPQGATIDMWMMRAAEYSNDAPTATQYAFMENEINRVAQELGWEPQQVQAAIWVAMKARMENPGVKKRTEEISEKNGWIRFDYPIKNGKPVKTRVILNAQAHRDNWLKQALAHDPTKEDTQLAKFDFSDGLRRHIGQISWEARPGRSTGVLPGVNDAPYEQQVEFQQAVQKALLDDYGIDLLAYKLGLLTDGPDILAPGIWQGEIAAGMQKRIAMAPSKGGEASIDPAQKKALDTYAAMLGLLLRQEGVGYHRPFYKGKRSEENGVDIDAGRTLTPDEAQALWGAIDERMRAAGVEDWENSAGLISSPSGMRVVNFGAIDDNKAFQNLVDDAASTLAVDELSTGYFASDGDLVSNDWKENANGEGYQERIVAAGSPDLLGWARDVLAPRVQSVFAEFSSRYGWGDPGRVQDLFGRAEQDQEVTQPAAQQAAPEGAQGARLSRTRQTDTPEFKRWFGDSKAVVAVNAETGAPLVSSKEPKKLVPQVMYHTTRNDFTEFEIGRITKNSGTFGDWETSRAAVFVTPDVEASQAYGTQGGEFAEGANVMPLYIKAENPLDLTRGVSEEAEQKLLAAGMSQGFINNELGNWTMFDGEDGRVVVDTIKAAGYDSVIFNDQNPDTGDSFEAYAVFNPTQIKSATGNTGAFDANNPDITQSRRRSPLGFYSALADGIDGINTNAAPAAGWKDAIKGLVNKGQAKADEVEWSGINDWLDLQQGKVTKQQVADYLRGGGVQVEEMVLGGGVMYSDTRDRREYRLLDDYTETKYDRYTLPGGENYREVLLTLPRKEPRKMTYQVLGAFPQDGFDTGEAAQKYIDDFMSALEQFPAEAKEGLQSQLDKYPFSINEYEAKESRRKDYNSGHWAVPNILASIRVNDRTDADGNRVLFVEELQSDWAQEGRKKGFDVSRDKALAAMNDARERLDEARANGDPNWRSYLDEYNRLNAAVPKSDGVPSAPFVTKTDGWLNLALKRVIAMAVDSGYDKVAFTTGEQNVDRYDLSKQVESIEYVKNPDGTYEVTVIPLTGRDIVRDELTESDLEEIVGKEIAQRIVNGEGEKRSSGVAKLTGVDLKVGGEGMKAFYDQIVPAAVKKLISKMGGRMERVSIGSETEDFVDPDTGEEYPTGGQAVTSGQPGFTVTPEMRSAVNQGLPLFSRRRNILGQPAPLASWTAPTDSKMDSAIYVMQDKLVDTKRVVQAIKDAAGAIGDKWNPYLQEELYHGRTAKQTQDFLSDELRPMLEDLQRRGIDIADFETYLHNRHAEERNAQIASINASMPDGGSGIDTADARAYLAGLDPNRRQSLEAVAQRIDAITKGTRDLLVASGLETADTIANWESAYSKYVPLQREDLDFSSDSGMGTGQGYQVRGPASRRATGSSKPVVDILANVAMQRERAIVRAEKAQVARAVYGLAVQNPNTDFWLAIDPAGQKDPAKAMADLQRMGINPIDAQNIIEEPTQSYVDPRTGLVTQRVNPLLRSSANVLAVRVNGEEKYVFFNPSDERAQRMVSALKNLDADQLGRVMGLSATISRYIASVNTQYNPVFGVINFTRDVQGAVLNLSTTPLANDQAEVLANVGTALRGIYSDLRSRRAGQGPATGTWATLWEEFQKVGGQTGFRDMFSRSDERGKALEKELRRISEGKTKQFGRAIFDWLSDYNSTMENAVRLSAYKVALDKGLSKEQAASIAKNLTVNFNRKGQVATQAGALYAFFNAAVQGSARLVETIRGPAGKKIVYGGLLLGSAQAMLLAAAGFDEDEPPEFQRERNVIIPVGGKKYIAIPMPLGFNVIPNTSRVLTEWMLSGWKNPTKRVAQITGAFLDAFNPIGNAGWSLQTIAPTSVDWLAALAENKDWTGKSIALKDRSELSPTPGYTRTKETATWLSKELAYYLNLASGGTKYKQGLVSPTPDQLDYLAAFATGGVGRELMKGEQLVRSAVTGEELPPYKIPLVGRVYGDAGSKAAESNRFYENLRRLNEHEAEIKGRRENREDVAGYRAENPESRLIQMANSTERDVQQLRKRRREMIEKGASKESVKIMEERIATRMKRFNDRVREVSEQP